MNQWAKNFTFFVLYIIVALGWDMKMAKFCVTLRWNVLRLSMTPFYKKLTFSENWMRDCFLTLTSLQLHQNPFTLWVCVSGFSRQHHEDSSDLCAVPWCGPNGSTGSAGRDVRHGSALLCPLAGSGPGTHRNTADQRGSHKWWGYLSTSVFATIYLLFYSFLCYLLTLHPQNSLVRWEDWEFRISKIFFFFFFIFCF